MIKAFNSVDHKALEAVFNEYYRALWYFANGLIDNRSEAEDIVVDSFLKLWKRRDSFDSEQGIKAFLYVTTRNACFNYLKHVQVQIRSQKELSFLHSDEDMADLKMIESDVLNEITREIKKLPPKMNIIFNLLLHGFSTEEISRKLNLSPATIRVQKAKAIKTIKLALLRKGLMDF